MNHYLVSLYACKHDDARQFLHLYHYELPIRSHFLACVDFKNLGINFHTFEALQIHFSH